MSLPYPILTTDWLVLREAQAADAPALLAVMQDAEVLRYYGMERFESVDKALDELRWFRGIFDEGRGARWVIQTQDLPGYIGDIGLHNLDTQHARAEVGFRLAREHWRKGIMTEALQAVLQYGFTELRLNRIEALVDPRNAACLRTLEKTGFACEGLLRDYEREKGGFVDLYMLSILKRDFESGKK